MTKKLNIAILSDSAFLTTGYANQARHIGNYLSEQGHNVIQFASTYVGQTVIPPIKFEDGFELKFKIHGQAREHYFKDVLSKYLKIYKIDVLVILLDTFMLYPWLLDLDLSPAKSIFWFPSDGGAGMPLGCEKILKKVDVPVAMARFGKEQCKKCHNIDVYYIPHSIDVNNFHPLSPDEKEKLKKKWGLSGKFVIGTVARNQGRKMLDRTIKIFAEFSKKNSDAILLLHLDPDDPAQVFPIKEMITRFNLENKILFTGTRYYKGFTNKDMNDVYNLMDIFILTTSGEGFGIPLIEAQACKIPVVATDYTTTKELVLDSNAGLGIDLVGTISKENPDVHGYEIIDGTITGSWAVERGICSIKDGVKKLQMLYDDEKLRMKLGTNGRINVLENYDINKVNKKWGELVTKLGDMY